jgi:hypothetical protein
MKYLAIALATAALTGAQTPAISIRPNTPGPSLGAAGPAVAQTRFGAPILGYVPGPGPLDLHFILGTGKAAQMGSLVALPKDVKHLFVPPRQLYLLREGKTTEPLAVWQPLKAAAETTPLTGAINHPDTVTFSARGDAAILYGKSADQLQAIVGLPAEPILSARPALSKWGEPSAFAVSDDGEFVVASLTDGSAIVSAYGTAWKRLPAAYGTAAMVFVSRSHSLIISDTSQQTLTLITDLTEDSQQSRILAHDVKADRLAVTREGTVLVAASTTQSKVWMVDLKTMTPAPALSSTIDTLLPLRDGHTFLLSSPGMGLLNVPAESDSAFSFVPVTR